MGNYIIVKRKTEKKTSKRGHLLDVATFQLITGMLQSAAMNAI